MFSYKNVVLQLYCCKVGMVSFMCKKYENEVLKMKNYLSLVPVSARVHRRQSRMTRICIVLAVFLVTALFSIADMWIRADKTESIRRSGNYHIILKNMPDDEAESAGEYPDVAAAAWCDEINPDADKDYSLNGKTAVLCGVEKAYLYDIRAFLTEGSYPEKDSEVMLGAWAKSSIGVEIGSVVTLHTPAGDQEYTVSGFCENNSEFEKTIDGSSVYMNREAFQEIKDQNGGSDEGGYYIRFKDGVNLKKAVASLKEQYGIPDEKVEENKKLMGFSGASSNETIKNVYPLAAFSFFLILAAGVMMISSCINSNVAQRTRFFGMLRCIGASKEQIMNIVRLEALNWCKSAIPAGCILGVVVNWILCAILKLLVKGEWGDMPLFGVSITGIVFGVAVGIVTVFIAAHAPARQAAKVSPVSAVSGVSETKKKIRHGANLRFFKVETALGIHHAVSAKKNLFLMTGSFALTIMLFLIFSACLDLVRSLLPSLNNFAPDIAIESQYNTNSLDRSLPEEISGLEGVECSFGTMMLPAASATINGREGRVDLSSYEEYMMQSSKDQVISGDLSKVYGDSNYALTIFSQDSRLDVGDKIIFDGQELEIACVLSFGIGGVSGEGVPTVVCSEETFTRLTGIQDYVMVNTVLEKKAPETTVEAIRALAGEDTFTDRREDYKMTYDSYWVIRVAVYGFLAIISLITLLNIMNSVSMSVSARIKQYGAMRAVGMESRQVTKMIAAEAVTYAVCGSIVGHIVGLFLHYLIYQKIILTHFGGKWKVPVNSIGVILLIVFTACVLAVYTPSKRIRNMAITDTINEL
ncbi:MAG TPA: hypothetical protein DD414_04815 [Lachnospiraceae bacterium]|nr:hypothetical protein [Lachnospiraceae bacterium]